MAKYTNFYETIAEAMMRLRRTVVMYDGEPFSVSAIANHRKDGVFRIYLDPSPFNPSAKVTRPDPDAYAGDENNTAVGAYLDEWMKKNPTYGLLRKKMDSPLFNNFRPFPLGMCNTGESGGGKCYYIERQPARRTEQGLTAAHLDETPVSLGPASNKAGKAGLYNVSMYSKPFYDTIKGKYPSAHEIIEALRDPDITNEAVAFHRDFAILRGPVGSTFLAYKDRVIGFMPEGDLTEVRLGRKHSQNKEVVEELGLFARVVVKK